MKKYILLSAVTIIFAFVILKLLPPRVIETNKIKVVNSSNYLIQTQWDQSGAYAKFVKHDKDAGCWATALAQIAYFHKLSPLGKIKYTTSNQDVIDETFESTESGDIEYPLKLEESSTVTQIDQVARYIYNIAVILYTDFGSSGYLEHETMMARIAGHLGVEVTVREYDKNEFIRNQSVIVQKIKNEIDKQNPLMIYFEDYDKLFGHAAVIDGYVREGDLDLIHLNMGWGGEYDGWYNLFENIMSDKNDLNKRFIITISPESSTK